MRSARGLSLLDALIGLAVAVFLMSALGVFVLFQNRKLGAETRTVAAQQEMRAALELILADLREAGARAPEATYAEAPGLCVREDDRLRLTLDRNGDGDVLGAGEDVTYCHCPATATVYRAWRETGGGTFTVERLAESASALAFAYAPRTVTASIEVTVSTPLGAFVETGRSQAFLRNAAGGTTCGPGPQCPPAGECAS